MATSSEFKIQSMMQECNITRKAAISYLEGDDWVYSLAVESFVIDSMAVHNGALTWKECPYQKK